MFNLPLENWQKPAMLRKQHFFDNRQEFAWWHDHMT